MGISCTEIRGKSKSTLFNGLLKESRNFFNFFATGLSSWVVQYVSSQCFVPDQSAEVYGQVVLFRFFKKFLKCRPVYVYLGDIHPLFYRPEGPAIKNGGQRRPPVASEDCRYSLFDEVFLSGLGQKRPVVVGMRGKVNKAGCYVKIGGVNNEVGFCFLQVSHLCDFFLGNPHIGPERFLARAVKNDAVFYNR